VVPARSDHNPLVFRFSPSTGLSRALGEFSREFWLAEPTQISPRGKNRPNRHRCSNFTTETGILTPEVGDLERLAADQTNP
jgi:hypothetical protein